MLGPIFIYGIFAFGCFRALSQPWIGLLVFMGFAALEPTWNWRWSIDTQFPFQKYLAAATVLGCFLTGFRFNGLQGPAKHAALALVGFLMLAFISLQFSIAPAYSGIYMDVLWKVVVMNILVMYLIDSPKKLIVLMWVILIAQGYNAYQINMDYFQSGFCRYARYNWGYKGDNNTYSIFTIPVMALALGLLAYSQKLWQIALAGLMFVLQSHQVMMLESRGSMIGALGMVGAFIVFMPKNVKMISLVFASVIIVGALAGPGVIEEFSSSFASGENQDSSATSRYEVWKAGALITKDYPLLGVGPYAGQFLVPKYYLASDRKDNKGLHNLLFEISTGCGVPATILYLLFFGILWLSSLLALWRLPSTELQAGAGAPLLASACGIPGYWLASMFSSGALLETSYMVAAISGSALSILQSQAWNEDESLLEEQVDDSVAVGAPALSSGHVT